jgi:hypothetical protein
LACVAVIQKYLISNRIAPVLFLTFVGASIRVATKHGQGLLLRAQMDVNAVIGTVMAAFNAMLTLSLLFQADFLR